MKRLFFALAAMLAWANVDARAACVPVEVRYDPIAHAVDAQVTLPSNVDSLSLVDLERSARPRWRPPIPVSARCTCVWA
ncbi:MAG: hypothetical protein ABT19_09565 [Rhodanobacter sp. SCN 68-63]|nr:MAG: hypothetical protein ABT19_09565 [Rhodanobacter sp. SCN 68-63]